MMSVLVVRNIPRSFEAIDLRLHFAEFIQAKQFAVFHFLGRAELRANPETLEVVQSNSLCCLLRMNSEDDERALISKYSAKSWRDRTGKFLDDCVCVIQRVRVSTHERTAQESRTPSFATQKESRAELEARLANVHDQWCSIRRNRIESRCWN
jgi:hypothetical protein